MPIVRDKVDPLELFISQDLVRKQAMMSILNRIRSIENWFHRC